tara:strand:+ start:261 stop:1010 length:750 start_codon:yes stop_codon:yes gene_type:complete
MTSLMSGVKLTLMKKLSLYIFLVLMFSSSVFAGNIIIPSIEKIFKERIPKIDRDEPFYGCIYFIEYGDEDLFTQKRKILSIRIGNSNEYASLYVSWEEYKEVPKIGDCFAFTTYHGLGKLSEKEYYGMAKIFFGDYKVDNVALIKKLSNEITVDQYFEEDVSYGKKRIVLVGEVEKMNIAGDGNLNIDLVSNKGLIISSWFNKSEWSNNDSLKDRIRSIKQGDVIKIKGYFMVEMGSSGAIFEIQKIFD